jgi:DNA-binding transcriptional MerR regulator
MADEYPVGEVARLASVSVRTLHHYDAIGLLHPSGRTAAGYRTYSDDDLRRLQQILYYRALDFGLDDIATMLAAPGATVDDHLRRQHRLLRDQIGHRHELLAAIEKEMEARQMGISLTPEEQLEIFGSDKFTGEYAAEAEERWGDTDQWKESQRRASAYTKDDWLAIKASEEENRRAFAAALAAELPPDSPEAMAAAEAHREHIGRWFYECGYPMQRSLADMYIADPRFAKTYDDVAPGLAQYVHDAIAANADAHGA